MPNTCPSIEPQPPRNTIPDEDDVEDEDSGDGDQQQPDGGVDDDDAVVDGELSSLSKEKPTVGLFVGESLTKFTTRSYSYKMRRVYTSSTTASNTTGLIKY